MGVNELDVVPDIVGVTLLLMSLVRVGVAIFELVDDTLAPTLIGAVIVKLTDEESDAVVVAVVDGVDEEVRVLVMVGVTLGDAIEDKLLDGLGVGVDEELAPNVNDDVGVTERDEDNEIDVDGVIVDVPVDDDVNELVAVPEGEIDGVNVELNVGLVVMEPVVDTDNVVLTEAPILKDEAGVIENDVE